MLVGPVSIFMIYKSGRNSKNVQIYLKGGLEICSESQLFILSHRNRVEGRCEKQHAKKTPTILASKMLCNVFSSTYGPI